MVRGSRRGAGGHLGEWAGSSWCGAGDLRWAGRLSRTGRDLFKGGEEPARCGGTKGARCFEDTIFVFGSVHVPIEGRGDGARAGRGGVTGRPLGASLASGVGSGVFTATVSAVGGGHRAAAGH